MREMQRKIEEEEEREREGGSVGKEHVEKREENGEGGNTKGDRL